MNTFYHSAGGDRQNGTLNITPVLQRSRIYLQKSIWFLLGRLASKTKRPGWAKACAFALMLFAGLFLSTSVFAQITQLTPWTKACDQSGIAWTGNVLVPNGSNRMLVVAVTTTYSDNASANEYDPLITYTKDIVNLATLTKATGNGADLIGGGGSSGRAHTWLYYLKDNTYYMDGSLHSLSIVAGSTVIGSSLSVYFYEYDCMVRRLFWCRSGCCF